VLAGYFEDAFFDNLFLKKNDSANCSAILQKITESPCPTVSIPL
jgi:hypothetical protein